MIVFFSNKFTFLKELYILYIYENVEKKIKKYSKYLHNIFEKVVGKYVD